MRKPPHTSKVGTYKLALLRYAFVEEENLPLTENDGWLPLEKVALIEDSSSIICDMMSYMLKQYRIILPDTITSTVPESLIQKEEILPFLTSLKEKNIRWPFFTGPEEGTLFMPNKFFRFIPIEDGKYTVNNRWGAPVDWKSVLHYYDTKLS